MIRVVLVDDEAAVRRGVRLRLDLEPDIAVVGESGDPFSACALVSSLAADVLVLDIEMPGLDGLTVASRLAASGPRAGVVILSLHDDEATRAAATAAGASAFVSKTSNDNVLVESIRHAARTAQERTTGD